MSYLMLADGNNIAEYYTAVPTESGEVMMVREDYFDRFSDQEYNYIMDQLEGADGVAGLFSKARARKQERRDQRKQGKAAKQEARQQRRTNFMDKLVGTVKSFAPGQGGEMQTKDLQVTGGVDFGTEPKWYQNPVVIVGGIALVGVGAYLAFKKK